MANGYFERGEIYFAPVGVNTVPALILSSNENNRNTNRVVVATMSSYDSDSEYSIKTYATGRESFINCDMVMCVLKKSLSKHLGTAPKEIMDQVDSALENIFDLGYVDDNKEAEIERLRSEVTRLEAQVASRDESILARGKEIANMNAKYNKAVDRIVELELERDVAIRIAERKAELVVEEKAEEPPVEEEPVVEEQEPVVEPKVKTKKEFVREKVNINTASCKEICEKLGMSAALGYAITGYRTKNGLFVDVEELREVPRITKPMFERIKDYIVIEEETDEPEPEEVDEPEIEEEPEENAAPESEIVEKVNINTASIKELVAVGFTPKAASQINCTRKNRGPIKSIDELTKFGYVTGKELRKLRDKLEV